MSCLSRAAWQISRGGAVRAAVNLGEGRSRCSPESANPGAKETGAGQEGAVTGQAGDTMPAIKKERPDREELALAAFNQPMDTIPGYLTAAIPVVTPHPPAYEHLFATHAHRAYLGLHEPHHPPLPDDLMLERFSSIPDFQPLFDQGEPCIEVECGENKALLYIQKLCQGSKGPSIRYRGEWLTPNEFQFVSGRETAKDWKRSIRHKGKSLKTLMSKGILQVHPPICDCPGCRISSPVNRGRLAEKRTIPLPPSRILKKEPCSVFSPGEESPKGNGEIHSVKLEEDLHISIMKRRIRAHWDLNISFQDTSCSRETDLSSIISNLRQSHQLVMPENQNKRNSHQLTFTSTEKEGSHCSTSAAGRYLTRSPWHRHGTEETT